MLTSSSSMVMKSKSSPPRLHFVGSLKTPMMIVQGRMPKS